MRLDPGVLQQHFTRKVPSDKWVVAGPWVCLGNGTVSWIDETELSLGTNGHCQNLPTGEGELATMQDSFARSIDVAATHLCGDDTTCFRRITVAALTKAEAMEEIFCVVWKSTATGKCMETDREHWVAFDKVGGSLSNPHAMRVALLIQKVKADIVAADFQRIPFKTICSSSISNPVYNVVCKEHPNCHRA